ncbi:uncharacterized protein LOC124895275 [Capsicum annuum]|uniref:uncharacterized protein LOC124895275 n=1 Tax=Capsicum annuum TaxID=4072 RepID=UPI001FB0B544|nr:uncharacterized protein LOC124895275 [Capsicum annuum]
MANFEENVMVALYWGGEIISDMSGFRYSEGAGMIVSMSISTSYIELVAMLHEKMRTNSENIQMDISGKYPCSFQGNITRFIEFKIENDQSLLQFLVIPKKFSNKIMYVKTRPTNHDNLFQMNGQHGYHMNLLAQNYGFAMLSHPHFAYTATPSIHQSLDASPNEHEYQSYDEGLSSQGHIESGHRQYDIRWEEDEPSEDDGESEILESESDEDTNDSEDLTQNDIGVNLHNQFGQSVSEMQNHDILYFTTLENEEDIFISTRESEMNCCSVWSDDGKNDSKKGMCFSSKDRLKRSMTIWSLRKNKEFIVVTSSKKLWIVRCKFHKSLGCRWFLRGRKVGGSLWKIGKYFDNHRCETEGLTTIQANLDTNLIASLFLNQIHKNPKLLVVHVISKVHEIFGHQVTYRKAWLGRQQAFKLVYGDFQKSFSELPKFFAAFQHFNHGTIVEWKHEESMSSLEVKTFKFVFWVFKPCIDGFLTCRPVISVDGTHLYGKYEIKLLIVVGIDNILPLAFAIVDRESEEAWKWFFRKLSAHVIKDREDVCIISDRAKEILASLSELWEENEEAYEYLMQFPLDKWTISHDDGKRWGVLTTNLSESFNGLLKKARGLSFTAMVTLSLEQIVERTYEVTERMGGLARNFVSEYFTTENYVATYFGSFSPVGHEAYWPSPSFIMRTNEFYHRPNRQRTTRVPNEMDRGPAVYGRACGLCR